MLFRSDAAHAVADCNKSLELDPGNTSQALNGRGYAYLRAGDLDQAIADYDAALRLNPSIIGSLYGRGVAYARKGHQAEAEKDISTARIMDPNIDREMAAIHITVLTTLATLMACATSDTGYA